jgi:hypothetical protein
MCIHRKMLLVTLLDMQQAACSLLLQIGFLGPAFFLTQLGKVHSPFAAVACMMASQGLDAFSQSGLYSNHQVDTCCSNWSKHEACRPMFWRGSPCLPLA